jgi:DNA-binding NarL/FixJ family response regulator
VPVIGTAGLGAAGLGAAAVGALTRINDGGTVFDPKLVVELLGRTRKADPLDALTSREQEVLALTQRH